jgi:hypothetical protein
MQSELLNAQTNAQPNIQPNTQEKSEQSAEPDMASAEVRESTAGDGAASDQELSEMRQTIEKLESRLAEYEIIAEDISEIGQLRQENADLKKQLTSGPAAVSAPATTAKSETAKRETAGPETAELETAAVTEDVIADTIEDVIEPAAAEEEALNSDQLLDEILAESKANRALTDSSDIPPDATEPESAAPSGQSMKLVSEKEVTKTEKELMAQFEETNRQKKGS